MSNSNNVFINCPFDIEYLQLRNALVFTIFDCGFIPRCALEEDNGGNVRFEKILRLIEESKYGVHDLSRTELNGTSKLPRFNMPFELGLFLGAKAFGNKKTQKTKNCLILDLEEYRYQSFISDIAGHDIRSHGSQPEKLISIVRNWLSYASEKSVIIPGGKAIGKRFRTFEDDIPALCEAIPITIDELTYNDYTVLISTWLKAHSTI